MKTASLTHTEATAQAEMSGAAFRGQRRCSVNRATQLGTTYAWFSAVLTLTFLTLFTACTSEPSKPSEAKPEVKSPELLMGRSAFQKVYVSAHGWQPDAKPYRLESTVTTDGNGHDGKAAVWRGSFASAVQRTEKSFTWSGSAADGAPERGVSPGIEDSYSASNTSTQVFDMAFLKIDSDQAFTAAQKHGGDKILEKEPDTPISYACDWNHNTSELVWHVIYGASRDNVKLKVAVNASTGEFIRVEK